MARAVDDARGHRGGKARKSVGPDPTQPGRRNEARDLLTGSSSTVHRPDAAGAWQRRDGGELSAARHPRRSTMAEFLLTVLTEALTSALLALLMAGARRVLTAGQP